LRIADHGKLGEDDQLRAHLPRPQRKLNDLAKIPGDVADSGVDLGKGDSHGGGL
jgi:hypothetical protein